MPMTHEDALELIERSAEVDSLRRPDLDRAEELFVQRKRSKPKFAEAVGVADVVGGSEAGWTRYLNCGDWSEDTDA